MRGPSAPRAVWGVDAWNNSATGGSASSLGEDTMENEKENRRGRVGGGGVGLYTLG